MTNDFQDLAGYYEGMRDYASEQIEKIKAPKVRATFHLTPDLCDWARNAVYWTPGLTMADLCESALRQKLTKLEHLRGDSFPKRKSELKGGRPLKSQERNAELEEAAIRLRASLGIPKSTGKLNVT